MSPHNMNLSDSELSEGSEAFHDRFLTNFGDFGNQSNDDNSLSSVESETRTSPRKGHRRRGDSQKQATPELFLPQRKATPERFLSPRSRQVTKIANEKSSHKSPGRVMTGSIDDSRRRRERSRSNSPEDSERPATNRIHAALKGDRSSDGSSSRRREPSTHRSSSSHGRDRSTSHSGRRHTGSTTSSPTSLDAVAIANQRRAAKKEDLLGGCGARSGESRWSSDPFGGSSHGPSTRSRSDPDDGSSPRKMTRVRSVPVMEAGLRTPSKRPPDPLRLPRPRSDHHDDSAHGKSSRSHRSDPSSQSTHSARKSASNSSDPPKVLTSPRRSNRREDALGGSRHGTRRSQPSTPVSSDRLQNLSLLLGGETARTPEKKKEAVGLDEEDEIALGELLTNSPMTAKELRKILEERKKKERQKRLIQQGKSPLSTKDNISTRAEASDLRKQFSNPDGDRSLRSPVSERSEISRSAHTSLRTTRTVTRSPFIPAPDSSNSGRSTSLTQVAHDSQHGSPVPTPSERYRRSVSLDASERESDTRSPPKHSILNKKYIGRKAEEMHARARQERRHSVQNSLYCMLDEQEH